MKNKNPLINNGISLGIHILLVIVFFIFDKFSGLSFDGQWVGLVILFAVMTCVYFISGVFLLKPVDKYSFLSVVSVILGTVIGFVCFIIFFDGSYEFLAYMNPLGNCVICLVATLTDGGIGVFALMPIALVLPSAVIYTGMLIKRISSKDHTAE